MSSAIRRCVIVEGQRTPFLRSGTAFKDMMAYELFREAMQATIRKAGIAKESVEYVIAGTVIQEIQTYNVAREAVLTGGLPNSVSCHTVTQACISSNQAITNAAMGIMRGEYEIAIAGGVETLSDVHIRYPRPMRRLMVKANFSKSASERVALVSRMLRPSHFRPDISPQVEYTTKQNMGQHCEKLNDKFLITREEQDAFAQRSHSLAAAALKAGFLSDLAPITTRKGRITEDNGVREASTAALAKLKPAYGGSITAASASFLSDGASCTLLMSEAKARSLGLKPKAFIRDWTYSALDPKGAGLLLGPSLAVAKLLKKQPNAQLSFKDIDVFE